MRSYTLFDIARLTSKHLLDLNAIIYGDGRPFEFASGRLSPVYVDTRLIWGYPAIRNQIVDMAIHKICDTIGSRNFDVIAGGATAGIPLALLIAHRMDKAFVYVRSSRKDYGAAKQVEGRLNPNSKVLLVDDLISGGSSKIGFLQALADRQVEVAALFVLFSYGFDEVDRGLWYAQGINLHYMTNFKTTLDVAQELGSLTIGTILLIREFLGDPDGWQDRYKTNC